MNDVEDLLTRLDTLEAKTKHLMLGTSGATCEEIRTLFLEIEILAEQGLELYPEETFTFSRRRAHAQAGGELMNRTIREAHLEIEGRPETNLDRVRALVGFLRSITSDLEVALSVLPNDDRLQAQMRGAVGILADAIIFAKQLEAEHAIKVSLPAQHPDIGWLVIGGNAK